MYSMMFCVVYTRNESNLRFSNSLVVSTMVDPSQKHNANHSVDFPVVFLEKDGFSWWVDSILLHTVMASLFETIEKGLESWGFDLCQPFESRRWMIGSNPS